MSASRNPLRVVALLSFWLLGCTQLFGLSRGFECFCSGRAALTTQDHCHRLQGGPQDLGEHASSTIVGEHFADGCDTTDPETEQHSAVQENAESLLPVPVTAATATLVLVAVLPTLATTPTTSSRSQVWAPRTGRLAGSGRPPPSLEAARTVVLLI